MKQKIFPIYLFPDHGIGTTVFIKNQKQSTFMLHHDIKKCVAECEQKGIKILVLEDTSLKNLPKAKGIFVSADRNIRQKALKAGHLAACNLEIARHLAVGGKWVVVKLTISASRLPYLSSLQSYFVESLEKSQRLVIGLLNEEDLQRVMCYHSKLQVLDVDPAKEDLIMVQLEDKDGAAALYNYAKLLFSDGNRHFIALKAGEQIDELPVHGAHGHNFALFPDTKHLPLNQYKQDIDLDAIPAKLREPLVTKLIDWWKYLIKPSTATSFESRNSKYSGLSDLDGDGPLSSRHILHPDNPRTEDALFDELIAMGYSPQKHSFVHNGTTYNNIVADLPGNGRWILKARFAKLLAKEFGKSSYVMSFLKKEFKELSFEGSEEVIKTLGNNLLDLLRPYRPWWRYLERLRFGAKIVVVGCHLDSTAANSPGYNPATDMAPGRDDNASGIAGVLEMANYFRHFENCFTHTIRFCFFNAEEQGLIGSKAYAQFLKSNNAPVKAAICMDMIGYNTDSNHLFEIHAGYTDATLRDLNVPFANEIEAQSVSIFGAGKAQVYQGTNSGSGTDRMVYDGAINRSDHAAFHEQGYPAVVVSEDFFANLSTEPTADGNPNYHRQNDTVIDPAYASKITCAIARAVREFVK